MLPTPPPPTLRLDIDRDALAANWRTLNDLSGTARAGAAVKADCYGLGVARCVPTLRDAGARDFFVAHWSEVGAMLDHVPASQVAVLHGANSADEVSYALATGALPVINSLHQARLWTAAGGKACHVMIDSGIHRLGIDPSELDDPALAGLDIQVLMSHLACADENSAMNAAQLTVFKDMQNALGAQSLSLANSAGIALGTDYAFDLTRPGLALYGGIPRAELAGRIRQVAFPRAALIQVRDLKEGDTVGYNGEFTASGPMRVGTVSLGYADGFLRSWGGKGNALNSEGRALPLLGKVSMDMVVVDLANAPDLKTGDWVDVPYDLPKASKRSGLSQYELLTILGQRFAR
ncbi:alanine racemase [Parerythrobacter jejuensis]|uniref:alanine racemase n=1 Tax=Parerythrobacter jejuensis TaxID=795812 RepID=A0A845AU64_9SPHN|nr:alanine racemase [Parerythrobacter jejuensis]MXP32361.1 alanine racemase [Parerythrobacter jejuensis]